VKKILSASGNTTGIEDCYQKEFVLTQKLQDFGESKIAAEAQRTVQLVEQLEKVIS